MNTVDDFAAGQVLMIDKPLNWTSFDVVKKLRNTIGVKKIGHAGTLDPLASGLLIVCTGKFTKKIDEYQNLPKEYTGTITLGKTTPSFDLETAFDSETIVPDFSSEILHQTANRFLGEIQQIPPQYSAIKIDGERVYKHARKNKVVQIEPRSVTVHEFDITGISLPDVYFRITCSKGTYIRSIAHDFGQLLGVGGHLSSLRRTKIGQFDVANAWSVESLTQEIKSNYANH